MTPRSAWGLFTTVTLRGFRTHRLRHLLTAAGIALGVGIMIAIVTANRGSMAAFEDAGRALAGRASVSIRSAAGPLPEPRLGDLTWLFEYGVVSPVIRGSATILGVPAPADGIPEEIPVEILAVDLLADPAIREYDFSVGENGDDGETHPPREGVLDWIGRPRSVILPEKLARRLGVAEGDRVALLVGSRMETVTVTARIGSRGIGGYLDGHLVLMDIAAGQDLLKRHGTVDWLDVGLSPGLDAAIALDAIRARLPAGVVAHEPQARVSSMKPMIRAFQFNLDALAAVAVLVGLFLVYGSVENSVLQREREIGILRGLGASRTQVASLFLGEAAILGAVGIPLGLAAGYVLSGYGVFLQSGTLRTFYLSSAAVEGVRAIGATPGPFAAAAVTVGALVLVAAWIPASRAGRIDPAVSIGRAGLARPDDAPVAFPALLGAALLVVGFLLAHLPAWEGLPVAGMASAVCVLLGSALFAPLGLLVACQSLDRVVAFVVPRTRVFMSLVTGRLLGGMRRIAVPVAALAVSLGLVFAIAVMIRSFETTLDAWLDETLAADIYVRGRDGASPFDGGHLDPALAARLAAIPGVRDASFYTNTTIAREGREVPLGVVDFGFARRQGLTVFKSGGWHEGESGVIVNEPFSLREGKGVGDELDVEAATGRTRVRILGVVHDYANTTGRILIDRGLYRDLFGASVPPISSLAILLEPEADPDRVKGRMMTLAGETRAIEIRTNGDLRVEVRRIFDATFAVTYVLKGVAVAVALLGILAVMTVLVRERFGDIAVLRALGASRTQVALVFVAEAVILAAVCGVLGAISGLLLSLLMVFVLNVQAFHWTLQYAIPWGFAVESVVALTLVGILGGAIPALLVSTSRPARYLRYE